MHYQETSAKENIGISEAIMDVLQKAVSQKGEEDEYIKLVVDYLQVCTRCN